MTPVTNLLVHDLFEEVVQSGVAVGHHDRTLVRERVIQVADDLDRHVRFPCSEQEKGQTTKRDGGINQSHEMCP